MENMVSTPQSVSRCTLNLNFSTKDELQKSVKDQCGMEYSIQENPSATEKFFTNHGEQFGIVLIILFAILTIFLFFKVRRQEQKSLGDSASPGGSATHGWMQRLQTPEGMLLALLIGTVLTCGLGIFLVAIYKWLGINDDFGQGSGSLVQAIWGSAVTITAAVVAILLALEAIKTAETTNKLQKEANQLSEYESPVYKLFEEIHSFKRRYELVAIKLWVQLSPTKGDISSEINLKEYKNNISEIFSICEDISKSDALLLLRDKPLSSFNLSGIDLAIITDHPCNYLAIEGIRGNYEHSFKNFGEFIIFYMDWSDKLWGQLSAHENKAESDVYRALRFVHWGYLYTFRVALESLSYQNIQYFVEGRMSRHPRINDDFLNSNSNSNSTGKSQSNIYNDESGQLNSKSGVVLRNLALLALRAKEIRLSEKKSP